MALGPPPASASFYSRPFPTCFPGITPIASVHLFIPTFLLGAAGFLPRVPWGPWRRTSSASSLPRVVPSSDNVQHRKREKEEEARAREELRKKLEEDRKERRRRLGLPEELTEEEKVCDYSGRVRSCVWRRL